MKQAVIYEKKGVLYFRASSTTTEGLSIDDGPCIKIEVNTGADKIGESALSILTFSKNGIQHPTNWNTVNAELLQAAGVKTWATFGKGAKCVLLFQEKGVKVKPTRNTGQNATGFMLIPGKEIELLDEPEKTELGTAIYKVLKQCE